MTKSVYISSSKKFLVDVKTEIKWRYGNQQKFARSIHYSRKVLNRVLNRADELNIYWINLFCTKLELDFSVYLRREMD